MLFFTYSSKCTEENKYIIIFSKYYLCAINTSTVSNTSSVEVKNNNFRHYSITLFYFWIQILPTVHSPALSRKIVGKKYIINFSDNFTTKHKIVPLCCPPPTQVNLQKKFRQSIPLKVLPLSYSRIHSALYFKPTSE